MSVVTLIGSGQMASALSFPLIENGHEVRLVGSPLDGDIIDRLRQDRYHINLKRTLHDGIRYYKIEDLNESLQDADLVVCGVSSFGVDWFADEILPVLDEDIPVLSVTKGMLNEEDGSLVTYPEYWERKLQTGSKLGIYAIGGPCTARDLSDHDQSFVGFCGRNLEKLKWIRSLFETDYYVISLTEDVVGLESAVALKNGYALGTALAIGMAEKLGDDGVDHNNSEAALFQQSVKEMMELLKIVGGRPENIMFAAGDLNVTVAAGRSRTVGLLLGKGYPIEAVMEELKGQTLEAVVIATRTAEAVKALAKRGIVNVEDYPLLMHVDGLLNHGEKLNIPWKKFQKIM
ncbi:glycerol-3-phosphate dehydrogenase [Proteiniclasticum ruminis]|uniref:Glycerol-3-phosphate dehydrogenase n=1 Tax=Proteiniclasticum ruminis TaxID=398199 RepID=A0A1I4YUN4_9CLOT|nr:glycerol-3-phosphate dehydrogenase [Proteiniclasticum ruminis]SFN41745.1 glycerol-3-phosphate dehydrogenase (NAD(P)+) [Proteiniclasticum ruminis]